MNNNYEKWWGDKAEYDVAQDLEDVYENSKSKSAVYWERNDLPNGSHIIPKDNLEERPMEYMTCGYTCEFECWGQEMVSRAVENGCDDIDTILQYVKKYS